MSCHGWRKGGPGTHPRGQVLNDRRTGCGEELKFSASAARSSSNSHPAFDPAPNCPSSPGVLRASVSSILRENVKSKIRHERVCSFTHVLQA